MRDREDVRSTCTLRKISLHMLFDLSDALIERFDLKSGLKSLLS